MSYSQRNQPTSSCDGYISPNNLMNMPNTRSTLSESTQHRSSAAPSEVFRAGGAKLQHVALLQPGKQHQLSQDPVPTPQSILDGSYEAALKNAGQREIVVYVPRIPEYCGQPSLSSIVFSVNGKPGPYLKDLMKGRVTVDSPFEELFKPMLWNRTSLTIDWPGVTPSTDYISCSDKSNFRTRGEVATVVAGMVAELLRDGKLGKRLKWGPQTVNAHTKPWNMLHIDYRDVRLIALNYYRKTWVPVLAMDA